MLAKNDFLVPWHSLSLEFHRNFLQYKTWEYTRIHKERSCDSDCRCKSCASKTTRSSTASWRSTRIPGDLSSRCGEDSVKSDPKFDACADGRRRTGSPCLKAKHGCKIACACKNCENPNGENKKSVISPVKRERKRKRKGKVHSLVREFAALII